MDNLNELYLEDIKAIAPCTEEEREELLLAAQGMDQVAVNRLVEGHLYLVPEIAKAYEEEKVTLADLISEGNTALFMAVYEYEGGNFLSYIQGRIMDAMENLISETEEEALNEKRVAAKVNMISEASSLLAKELHREATVTELATRLGMEEGEVESALKIAMTALEHYANKKDMETADAGDDPLLKEATELLREEEEDFVPYQEESE